MTFAAGQITGCPTGCHRSSWGSSNFACDTEMLKETMVFTSQYQWRLEPLHPHCSGRRLTKIEIHAMEKKEQTHQTPYINRIQNRCTPWKNILTAVSKNSTPESVQFDLKSALKIVIKNLLNPPISSVFWSILVGRTSPVHIYPDAPGVFGNRYRGRAAHATGRIARNDDKSSVKNCEWDVLKPLSGFN